MEIQPLPRRRGRPPSQGEPRHDTREELLRAGVASLTEKGFVATGIDAVLRSVGVPKGSFYHYFASKEAFGAELIDRYGAYFAKKLERHLTDETLPAHLDRLRAFIADAQAGMARHDYRRGCLIGNLGQETGALPAGYSDRLNTVFADWQARVAACLRRAQANGEIAARVDCERQAAFFWIGWEGAVLRAKLERQARPLEIFVEAFFAGLPRR